ncbi:MAG: hypothetical protein JSV03_01165 [Planctomycetota bacterium]|nr:MAG: hypothetical protein JSV03_01165 [Planctomycetota bacterium]
MNRIYKLLPNLTVGIMLITGCGPQILQGSWVTREVHPPSGQKHYNLAKVTFNKDMTFESVSIKNSQKTISKGTYEYDIWKKQLTLHTKGKELTYSACVWWGDELRVEKTISDTKKITLFMNRPQSAKKCPHCGAVLE